MPNINLMLNIKPIFRILQTVSAVGFSTWFLPKPKNRVTRSFLKTEKPVFGCL